MLQRKPLIDKHLFGSSTHTGGLCYLPFGCVSWNVAWFCFTVAGQGPLMAHGTQLRSGSKLQATNSQTRVSTHPTGHPLAALRPAVA